MVSGVPLVPAETGSKVLAEDLQEFAPMPSLIRLIMVLGLLGGFGYGAMFALANFVQPKQREMSITIPPQKLTKPN